MEISREAAMRIDDDLLRSGHVCIFCYYPWWNHIFPGGKGCSESAWKVLNGTSVRPWLSRVATAPKTEDGVSRMKECPDCRGRGFISWRGRLVNGGRTTLHKRCKKCSGKGECS